MSRGRKGPAEFLGNFEGILQTNDYVAYERGIGGPKMVHACCWRHARRHFVDAVKLNRQDAASVRAVEFMDALFAVDREAREAQMDHADLDQIREHILATSKTVLPKSAAGKACHRLRQAKAPPWQAVFLLVSDIAREVDSMWKVLIVWTAGGVIVLFGALCYAEFGAAIAVAGGDYVYLAAVT
jgi:hypothetical protein